MECTLVSSYLPPEPLLRKRFSDGLWQYLAIDYKGNLPNGQTILVNVGYFSRIVEIEFWQAQVSRDDRKITTDLFTISVTKVNTYG